MPTSAEAADLFVDTSVAVALAVADHHHHEWASEAVSGHRLGLAGHAAFETYSVLTRLPAPARRDPVTVRRLLDASFPATRFLPDDAAAVLLAELPALSIAGGAVYDALVGATARHHGAPLITRDRRAIPTYRALEVPLLVLDR